jgi:aspartyl protease family protein
MAVVLQQLPRITLLLLLAAGAAQAQTVSLAGRMGERALLVIDGQPRALAVGQAAGGVKLLRWVGAGEQVEVEFKGGTSVLRLGSTPAQLGAAPTRNGGREIVISAGPGGHFVSSGAINGRPVRFMVDTGATLVSLGLDDARRLGIDLGSARKVMTHTANGAVPSQLVTLNSVRVGDVELHNVGAVIVPQPMPMVLLGNSFLSRLQMRRDNDVMRLELR